MMENNTPTQKIAQMSWQDIVFGFTGAAAFVGLLFVFV